MDQLFSNAKLFALCCSFGVNVFNLPDQCSLVCDSHPISALQKFTFCGVYSATPNGQRRNRYYSKRSRICIRGGDGSAAKKKPSKPETIGYPRILIFASERACHHLYKR
jgi:hypothetical protein